MKRKLMIGIICICILTTIFSLEAFALDDVPADDADGALVSEASAESPQIPTYELGREEDLAVPIEEYTTDDFDPNTSEVTVDAEQEGEITLQFVESFDYIEALPEGEERTLETTNYYTTNAPSEDDPTAEDGQGLIITIWHKFLELLGIGEHTIDILPVDASQVVGRPHDAGFAVTEAEEAAPSGGDSGYYDNTPAYSPNVKTDEEEETGNSDLPIPEGWSLKRSFQLIQSMLLGGNSTDELSVHNIANAVDSSEALLFTRSSADGTLQPIGSGFQTNVGADVTSVTIGTSPVSGQVSDSAPKDNGGFNLGNRTNGIGSNRDDYSAASGVAASTGVAFVGAKGETLRTTTAADGFAMLEQREDGSTTIQVNTPTELVDTAYGVVFNISQLTVAE